MPEASISVKAPRKGRFSWSQVVAALGLIVLAAAWLVPNHYLPWPSFHNEAMAFLALALLLLASLSVQEGYRSDAIPILVVFAVLIVGLQWATGLIAYRGDAVLSGLYLAGFMSAWCLGRQAGSHPERQSTQALDWLAIALVIASAVSVYIALLQWLGLEAGSANLVSEKEPGGRSGGNLGQPNHLATLLLMGSVLSLYLNRRGYLRSWQLYGLLGWLAVGLTTTESRTALLSALVMGAFFLWKGRQFWRRGIRMLLIWWATLAALWLSWAPLNQALLLTATRDITAVTHESARLHIWRQMLVAIEQSPWWGYGWRQTVVAQKAGSAVEPAAPITDYAHNLALDLMVWLGVPMASLLLLGIAWWLLRAAIRVKTERQWVLMAAAVPVLIHSMLEFPFAYAYFLFPCAALLGMLATQQEQARDRTWFLRAGFARLLSGAVLGLFAGISGWAAYEYSIAEEDFRVMRFEMRKVGQRPVGHEPANLLLLDQLGEMLQLGRILPSPGMPERDIQRFRVASDNTMWATAQMRYAVALGLNGRPDEATQELRKLRDFYGDRSYAQARNLILELRKDQYPQLQAVELP